MSNSHKNFEPQHFLEENKKLKKSFAFKIYA